MSARVQDARARWQEEQKQTRRMAIALGVAAGIVIGVYAFALEMSPSEVALSLVLGGLGWGLLGAAFHALTERTRREPNGLTAWAPHPYAPHLVLGFLVLVSFYGLLRVPGIAAPLVLGAVAWLATREVLKLREVSRPRTFLAVHGEEGTVPVPQGANLLEALEGAGYRLLTQCGRKGQCATCRVRVREGAREWTQKEQGAALTPRQKGEGWVLSCQVAVHNDMEIELFKPLVLRWPSFTPGQLSDEARALRRALPGFHCEVCGYRLCEEYAQAIAERREPLTRCLPGGEPVRRRLEEIAQALAIPVRPAEEEKEKKGTPSKTGTGAEG